MTTSHIFVFTFLSLHYYFLFSNLFLFLCLSLSSIPRFLTGIALPLSLYMYLYICVYISLVRLLLFFLLCFLLCFYNKKHNLELVFASLCSSASDSLYTSMNTYLCIFRFRLENKNIFHCLTNFSN